MQNSLKSLIDSAKSVLILLPKGAAFDEVAAGLSLYLSLTDKKEATIGASDPMVVEFNRLIGVNRIQKGLGDFPALKMEDLAGVRTAHVGTSEVRIDGREIISLDRPSSSISEVAASLIRESDKNVNSDIATNLLMGIEEATKSFTTPEV